MRRGQAEEAPVETWCGEPCAWRKKQREVALPLFRRYENWSSLLNGRAVLGLGRALAKVAQARAGAHLDGVAGLVDPAAAARIRADRHVEGAIERSVNHEGPVTEPAAVGAVDHAAAVATRAGVRNRSLTLAAVGHGRVVGAVEVIPRGADLLVHDAVHLDAIAERGELEAELSVGIRRAERNQRQQDATGKRELLHQHSPLGSVPHPEQGETSLGLARPFPDS